MQVFIRNLELMAQIGVHGHEHQREQPVRINVDMTVHGVNMSADKLDKVVDYEALTNRIRSLVAEGHVKLAETLANRIANLCLTDTRVRTVRVRVEKLHALPGAESGGVEIERESQRTGRDSQRY
jgi:dihydroneopterin aldolase